MVVVRVWLVLLVFFLTIGGTIIAFNLRSRSFEASAFIDKKFSCEGEDISPHLAWSGAPQDTQSFALIVDDPDAPLEKPWVHWIIFNIPKNVSSLKENESNELNQSSELKSAIQGTNDFHKLTYGGPCPPRGKPHRYYFKLYALDQELPLHEGCTKEQLLNAMDGHILEQAELIGLYQRL